MAHRRGHRSMRRRRGRRRNPVQARRYATLRLLFNVKRNRRFSPDRVSRRKLVQWFMGRDWSRKIRKLSDKQIRAAVDLNGNWNPRRLSWSAREALGYTYERNNLTGRGRMVRPSRPMSAAAKVQKQKREMRVATRNIFSKKSFGTNRLRLLQNTAFKNSQMDFIRDQYPDLADARPELIGSKSTKTLMAEARGGRGIRGRRVKKLIGEHGSWSADRTDGGEFVTLDGKQYRGNYHTYKDGTTYTGRFPTNGIRWTQVLIPRDQYEDNVEVYREIFRKSRHIDRRTGRVKNAEDQDV